MTACLRKTETENIDESPKGESENTMKKLGLTTALVLTLVFGAGSVFAAKQNTNSSTTNAGSSSAGMSSHHRRHHRRHHRSHRKAKAANANT
jgi:hypothetical protein